MIPSLPEYADWFARRRTGNTIAKLLVMLLIVGLTSGTKAFGARMEAAIGGSSGSLPCGTTVVEVWKTGTTNGEIVVEFRYHYGPRHVAKRVLLKGVDTTFVADEYSFSSNEAWQVTGKQTYTTIKGVERSILVAERALNQVKRNAPPFGSCVSTDTDKVYAKWLPSSQIIQILNDKEMLARMYVSTGLTDIRWDGNKTVIRRGGNKTVLLRGVDTTALTEDSRSLLSGKVPCYSQFPISGTYRYKSTNGTMQTVFVADNVERIRKADIEDAERIDRADKAHMEAKALEKLEEQIKRFNERQNERQRVEALEKKRQKRLKAIEAEKALWRMWKSKNGVVLFWARFNGGIINGNVMLKKRDGTRRYIPLKELSAKDQEWIMKQLDK